MLPALSSNSYCITFTNMTVYTLVQYKIHKKTINPTYMCVTPLNDSRTRQGQLRGAVEVLATKGGIFIVNDITTEHLDIWFEVFCQYVVPTIIGKLYVIIAGCRVTIALHKKQKVLDNSTFVSYIRSIYLESIDRFGKVYCLR